MDTSWTSTLSVLYHLVAVCHWNSSGPVNEPQWSRNVYPARHCKVINHTDSSCREICTRIGLAVTAPQRSWLRFMEIIHFNGVVPHFFIIMFSTFVISFNLHVMHEQRYYNHYPTNKIVLFILLWYTKHKICSCTFEFFTFS
jgi:hypothetical protein